MYGILVTNAKETFNEINIKYSKPCNCIISEITVQFLNKNFENSVAFKQDVRLNIISFKYTYTESTNDTQRTLHIVLLDMNNLQFIFFSVKSILLLNKQMYKTQTINMLSRFKHLTGEYVDSPIRNECI